MTSEAPKQIRPSTESPVALDALERLSAGELLRFAFDRFGDRAVIGTSFQHGGLVLIDPAREAELPIRVFTIDTLRLHPETYQHITAVERHFDVRVEKVTPDPAAVSRMTAQHGEFLFFDSPDKCLHCCKIRKDRPNEGFLGNVDCWVTGLRRDQSEERAQTPRARMTAKYGRPLLKLSPLAGWSDEEVKRYVRARESPVNELYSRGYSSIGCAICTTPVLPWEQPRAGRWRWEHQGQTKECGLHLERGDGI